MMRKFFLGLGVLTALLLVAGGIGFFVLARNGEALDKMSKAYVDDSVLAIAANWNVDELWKRAGPRLRASVKREDLRNLFDALGGALGQMAEYDGSAGQATMSVVNAQSTVGASYIANARFRKGEAAISVALVKVGDAWMIEGFHVNSPALLKNLAGVRS
jgi:hypothetical protein